MKLRELLGSTAAPDPASDPEIRSLAYDSRQVEPGTLFFAIAGSKDDGQRYVPEAIERGTSAIVSEREAPAGVRSIWIRVPAIRRALSEASRSFYGHPESKLSLVGITGTNGKTTTSYLLESIFRAGNVSSGLMGTIEYHVGDRVIPAKNTTPESLDLAAHLADMVRAGARAAVMEVSSHALEQERVWGFPFSAAVFTNLTRDHLDYHDTMEQYFRAKRRLFEGLGTPPSHTAVINVDDPFGVRLTDLKFPHLVTYGTSSRASVRAKRFTSDASGIKAQIVTPDGPIEIESHLVGRPNLMNILAAVGAGLSLGFPRDVIQAGVAALTMVPGRFERVDVGQPFPVLVDYAHTDDALRNALSTAREFTRGRLIVVFGCGGDRDRSKRPLMGQAAGSLADLIVLTSDNPRSEDPLVIMNDALVGLQRTGKPYTLEVDRAAAIRSAVEQAREGDVVLIAGKGHENYQIFRDRTVPFDDCEVARQALEELGYGSAGDKKQT